eukprot:TRINITY_DN16484_c0_g1_i1.p2 TRINITY_DN16484_c0_g1~~TRINITY_DN16484_c0_g1_i1.p2  ORF type:complete len:233 (-),score=34.48 TRINITY_DN16484_c0_g1_i1:271-969(-)
MPNMYRARLFQFLAFASILLLLVSGQDVSDEVDDEYEEEEEEDLAFLIAHKSVKEDTIVEGRNLTFVLELYNAGSVAAKKILVSDWLISEENFTFVGGEMNFTVESIAPSKKYEHEYVVVPTLGGYVWTTPLAQVQYQANPDSLGDTPKTVYSTPVKFVVLTPAQRVQQWFLQLGSYVTFGYIRTIQEWRQAAIIFVIAVGLPSLFMAYNWLVEKNKELRRQKAYRDLTQES